MWKYRVLFLALISLTSQGSFAKEGIRFGMGFDYIPIAKLEYTHNSEANTEIFDNIIWQAKTLYDFGNGFNSGFLFDYFSKTIHPGPFRTSDLSLWGVGLTGGYDYEMTETGHLLLVGGAELGYGHLSDNSGVSSGKAGSFWIAGLGGVRFMIFSRLWLETDYRLSFQEFGPLGAFDKKYLFSGSSLRLLLEYSI